jgi:Ca2+-binding RTX toxin-like protein
MVSFADVVLDYFNSGAGSSTEPYGFVDADGDGFGGQNVTGQNVLNFVLGDDPPPGVNALSLPTGSFVTVGFLQGFAIDGPGNDIFIRESGLAGDQADIFVSSNPNPTAQDFVLLGRATDNVTTAFDLASIGFTQPVRAIRIVGLDNRGTSPGFDVANVQALQVQTALGDRILKGSANNDRIQGGSGNDNLTGQEGDDILVGGAGKDTLGGGQGKDKLSGGSGDDFLNGDAGKDTIISGKGRDRILLETGREQDIIRDFQDRRDKLAIAKGKKFSELTFTQLGRDTLVIPI